MQASEQARVLVTIDGPVAVATLNRPDVLNAVDDGMRADLAQVVERVGSDDSIRALVITGAGKGFCSGGDIRAMRERQAAPADERSDFAWRRQRRLHHLVMRLHALEKVTIAAVNGPAAGLGCDLALGCDFIIASSEATFVQSFILRGLVPDGGGMYFLPRRIGLAKAKEMIFTGRRVGAEEALALGLADRVTSPESLLSEATAWAASFAQQAPTALALAKSMLDHSFESTLEDMLAAGAQAQAICYTTREHGEAVAAFLARSSSRSRG
jgi:enoyl-CoA hydratase/carnithine racemase